ncbi:MAG TPA: glycosyltransferase family 4 protein [Polyangiaceae bacterium]
MTRVVHVVVAGETGGAERMLVDLATRAADTGAEHAVALFTPNEALRRMLREAGLRVHDRGRVREGPLPYLWRSLGPGDVAWLAGVLREERADVAHLHTFASQVLGTRAAARSGARILRTEHSTRVYDDPSCWPFSRWSLARADAAVAVSAHVRGVALGRAPWAAERMRVVPNGVDVEHFAPRDDAKADAFTFVLVGRLEPRKGVDLAVEALAGVPGARLDILGIGAERATIERKAREMGVADRVRFLGYAKDARPLLARAHAALCSSRSEGLGIALLEGMAMGLPVVGFAVGGVPEIVVDGVDGVDGATGMLCPAGDVAALSRTMREAMGAEARMREMGAAGRKRVVERFSVKAMGAGYAEVYDRLGSRRRVKG